MDLRLSLREQITFPGLQTALGLFRGALLEEQSPLTTAAHPRLSHQPLLCTHRPQSPWLIFVLYYYYCIDSHCLVAGTPPLFENIIA